MYYFVRLKEIKLIYFKILDAHINVLTVLALVYEIHNNESKICVRSSDIIQLFPWQCARIAALLEEIICDGEKKFLQLRYLENNKPSHLSEKFHAKTVRRDELFKVRLSED